MKNKKKETTPMEELTKGYEAFIKGKKVNANGKKIFTKTIKKAAKPRAVK